MTLHPRQPHTDLPVEREDLGNRAYSLYRTWVPIVWGGLLTFLATRIPAVHGVFDTPYMYGLFELAATGLWYTVWRFLEHRLPSWLVTFLLGSGRMPVYPPAPVDLRRAP